MKLTVLGKYGPYPNKKGCTSSYLLQSNTQNALIDVGSGSFKRLINYVDVIDLSFIILSHLHFDHVSDIGVLSYALSFSNKQGKINVYIPKSDSEVYYSISRIDKFNIIDIEENKEYLEGDLVLTFYKTEHPVLSYGVKIYCGDKIFGYTGDAKYTNSVEELAKDCDLLVADGAFLQKDYSTNKPHMSVLQVASLSNFAKKVLISHVNPNYKDSEISKEIKNYDKKVRVIKENKTYKI